jgi:LEA14-like dessication related protein
MKPTDLTGLKEAIHALSETDRATLRTYVLTVFDVRGRDTRVNLQPDDIGRPRLR